MSDPVIKPLSDTSMRKKLNEMYYFLGEKGFSQHAKDFWRMRAQKQKTQVQENGILHEYTAIEQYVNWHGPKGNRLPINLRGSDHSLFQ